MSFHSALSLSAARPAAAHGPLAARPLPPPPSDPSRPPPSTSQWACFPRRHPIGPLAFGGSHPNGWLSVPEACGREVGEAATAALRGRRRLPCVCSHGLRFVGGNSRTPWPAASRGRASLHLSSLGKPGNPMARGARQKRTGVRAEAAALGDKGSDRAAEARAADAARSGSGSGSERGSERGSGSGSGSGREGGEGKGKEGEVEDVVIVGAGVAGLATALALHRVGLRAVVLEQGERLREGGAALSLWGNGWRALEALGVAEGLRRGYSPLTRVELCTSEGRLLRDFTIEECVQGPHEVRGVHRGALLTALATELPAGTVRFASRPTAIREGPTPGTTTLELADGTLVTSRVLLGCDGTRSTVASWLGLAPARYCGYAAYRGVAHLPEGHSLGGTIRMVWGQGVRAGMYPLTDSEVYWFTCFNAPEDEGRKGSGEGQREAALSTVRGWAYGVEDVIERTPEEAISRSNITDRWTLPLPGVRWGKGGVSVLGDAAHPMTPNLGQGACTSLEDAVILARELASCCTVENEKALESKMATQELIRESGVASVATIQQSKMEASIETTLRTRRVLGSNSQIAAVLERFEKERIERTAPLTIRSFGMGAVLQLPYAPICFLRDNIAVPIVLQTNHFLDHALYDCGELPKL